MVGGISTSHHPDNAAQTKTAIAPILSVRRGAQAIEFYKAAFGAAEVFRIDDESGSVVARLSVGERCSGSPTSLLST